MDFFDGIRYLFNEVNDPEGLENMQIQLAKKLKEIKTLTEQTEVTEMACVFYKVQSYKLSKAHDAMEEHSKYSAQMNSILKKISSQTELMTIYLDQIELEKIRKYDELKYVEMQKQCQQQIEIQQNFADQMEKRNIVVQLRALQGNHRKVVEMSEQVKDIFFTTRKVQNMKLDDAIKKRNSAIVNLIMIAKHAQNKKNPQTNNLAANKVQVISSVVLMSAKPTAVQIEKPLQQSTKTAIVSAPDEYIFKVPSISPNPTDKSTGGPFKSTLFRNFPVLSSKTHFSSILRKRKQNEKTSMQHVTIKSPPPFTSNVDRRKLFLAENKDNEHKQNSVESGDSTAAVAASSKLNLACKDINELHRTNKESFAKNISSKFQVSNASRKDDSQLKSTAENKVETSQPLFSLDIVKSLHNTNNSNNALFLNSNVLSPGTGSNHDETSAKNKFSLGLSASTVSRENNANNSFQQYFDSGFDRRLSNDDFFVDFRLNDNYKKLEDFL